MGTLTLPDGVPLWIDDRGQGRPLLLLQGLQFPAGYFWQKNLEALAARHRVITLDLRGQGLSGKGSHGHSIAQCADDLAHVIAALDLHDLCLGGVAFGGMVVLDYLQRHGAGRLRSLWLSEMTPRLTNAEGWAHPTFGDFPPEAGAGFAAGVRADRTAALGGFLLGCFATTPDADTLAEMTRQTWLTPTDAVADLIDDMVKPDSRAMLAGISLPTLLIYGRRNNPVMPGEVGRWMAERIPDATLVELPDAGHSPFWDDPAGFNTALGDFAARH
ncbi:alpha/beta fold hydrolase [Sandaracinobacteroides saxicola]|uniref:Alpha/beta hydrolase n=1 Tax=Sandaracinobacteroides saxicola TaxID=2759707 RepID=A0A7G5II96_9SPHN|nr:alpha/beta hydrolase [Sandaracinobacteroides saxicola]QMW23088.1 alpha/beta hydrolase [Sandaracinobacteroides saxicola]